MPIVRTPACPPTWHNVPHPRVAAKLLGARLGSEVQPNEFLPFSGTGEDRFLSGVAEKRGVQLSAGELSELRGRFLDEYEQYCRDEKGAAAVVLPGAWNHGYIAWCPGTTRVPWWAGGIMALACGLDGQRKQLALCCLPQHRPAGAATTSDGKLPMCPERPGLC